MSVVPTLPKRPVIIGGLAATALLGVGVAAGIGIAGAARQPGDSGAAARVTVGLTSSINRSSAGSDDPDHDSHGRRLQAVLRDTTGHKLGWIRLTRLSGRRLLVQVHATHLTPGFHGIHVHSVGVCDPAGAKPFASAGPHFNPTHAAEGMQAGALPVLLANPDGTADARIIDANFTLADLAGTTGASVVVHAGTDNYANIPPRYKANGRPGPDATTRMSGDAGARIACAVLVRPAAATGKVTPSSRPAHAPVATPGPRTPAASATPAAGTPTATGTPATTGKRATGGTPGMATPRPSTPPAATPATPPTATPATPRTATPATPPAATPTPTVLYGKHW